MAEEEISNKTLAVIVVAAIVVTLGSTALIMRMGSPVITGMAIEQAGTAQFNITAVVSIDLTNTLVEFGAGVTDGGVPAIINTGDAGTGSVTNGSWSAYSGAGFVVENDGNVAINVTVYSSNDADGFIGGTAAVNQYEWKTDETTDDGSAETVTCGSKIGSYTEVSTTANATMFCSNLLFGSAADEVELDIQLTIPSDTPVGQKTSTLTFEAHAY